MEYKTAKLFTAVLFTLFLSGPQIASAADGNLLKDAGFDAQLPAHQGGWTTFDQSRISTDMARSGEHAMFNWGFSRTIAFPPYLTGTVSGSFQQFDAKPGSRWQMTGYGSTARPLQGVTVFGILQISFFDDDGNDLGTVETASNEQPLAKASNKLNTASPAGEWLFLDTGIATAPSGTSKVHAFTLYVDYSDSNIAQGVYFDDLSLVRINGG